MTALQHEPEPAPVSPVTFLALELTGRCQLACQHCYAESGPTGSHGTMTGDYWCNLPERGRPHGRPRAVHRRRADTSP